MVTCHLLLQMSMLELYDLYSNFSVITNYSTTIIWFYKLMVHKQISGWLSPVSNDETKTYRHLSSMTIHSFIYSEENEPF